jgi:hypothetical protein
MKSKVPKIDSWGTPSLLFPILKKISVMILFQFFVFCQMGSERVSYCSLNAIIMSLC